MVCNCLKRLDSGFRRNDGKRYFGTFYETFLRDSLNLYLFNYVTTEEYPIYLVFVNQFLAFF